MADEKRDDERKKDERAKAGQRGLVPDAAGNVIMEVIMGPYRGNYLTMTAADAEEAKDSHWARDPTETDRDHDHVLTEEDRQSAFAQAHAWAQTQWDAAQGVEPEPPPEARRRAMTAEEEPGYKTRQAPEPPKRR